MSEIEAHTTPSCCLGTRRFSYKIMHQLGLLKTSKSLIHQASNIYDIKMTMSQQMISRDDVSYLKKKKENKTLRDKTALAL